MKWFIYNLLGAMMVVWLVEWIIDLHFNRPLIFLGVYLGAYLVIWLLSWFFNRRYFVRFPRLLGFIGFIIKELFQSNFRVAYDVLTKQPHMNPAILALPLDVNTDREIVTLATLITFTPGTLSLEISPDRKFLYVHEMYVPNGDVEKVKQKLKNGFERRLIQLTRP
jgi:multicomponent Na+:H+ antiporter subunit E